MGLLDILYLDFEGRFVLYLRVSDFRLFFAQISQFFFELVTNCLLVELSCNGYNYAVFSVLFSDIFFYGVSLYFVHR